MPPELPKLLMDLSLQELQTNQECLNFPELLHYLLIPKVPKPLELQLILVDQKLRGFQ